MAKREKRLEKGIASLEKQEKIHEAKLEEARKLGKPELVEYYIKEIAAFEKSRIFTK